MSTTSDPIAQVHPKDTLVQMLQGKGIEIGALHRPIPAPHLDVTYVDEFSTPDMIAKYPELKDAGPVEVGIVDDGARLTQVGDATQDFVIASHLIEHLPNPISAMTHWQRVLKPGGKLLLVVPDKEQTFDKNREITTLEHLWQDFVSPDPARDYEHFRDFALHVSIRTYNAAPETELEAFTKQLHDERYSIHYHVWDIGAFRGFLQDVAAKAPDYQLEVVAESGVLTEEFAFVLQKPAV